VDWQTIWSIEGAFDAFPIHNRNYWGDRKR
jgi:hypothetical protein